MKYIFSLLILLTTAFVYSSNTNENSETLFVLQRTLFYTGPSETSRPAGVITKNTRAFLIHRTGKKETIRGFHDEWFEMKTAAGKTGFIFGAYIFEMKSIYSAEWLQTQNNGKVKHVLKLKKNHTFIFERHIKERAGNTFKKVTETGKFDFTKQGLKLVSTNINTELFFFRYKGKNALSGFMFPLDNNVPQDLLYLE